ncbi:uncharacterized protein J3R85_010583 [Psidium guajava]|nr:uncharacterized protein J3R85_010583 [Psidium guajava]
MFHNLSYLQGTSKIEALRLNNWGRSLTAEQLKELTNLRFLHVNRVNFTGDFQNLLPRLRWLQWNFYALDFEATNFCPKKLVVLDLSRTKISEDWGGWDTLKVRCRGGVSLVSS